MKATTQTLPLPNPDDWCTLGDAQLVLDLSRQQVWRLVKAKRLHVYSIGRTMRTSVQLFWAAELDEYAAARKLIRGDRG